MSNISHGGNANRSHDEIARRTLSVAMTTAENPQKITGLCKRNGDPRSQLGRRDTRQPLWETVWQVLRTVNTGFPWDPGMPRPGVSPRMFTAAASVTKGWKQPKNPRTEE